MSFEYQAGQEIQTGERSLVPFVKIWRFKFPNGRGALTWNRPASVLVRTSNGQEHILPVPDLTRRIILSLISACLGSLILFWIVTKIQHSR
jgi:hypothetical protein